MPPPTVGVTLAKVEEASLSVKVIVAVSPIFSLGVLLVIVTVGAAVSIVIGVVRVARALVLPAASVRALGATEMEPGVLELLVGVNVAV